MLIDELYIAEERMQETERQLEKDWKDEGE
jgi:hypothetical protein